MTAVATDAAVSSLKPTVLFACIHNAGRSQMAAAFMRHHSNTAIHVLCGGTDPATALNPSVVQAMSEVGVSISSETPRRFVDADVEQADVVVTMGCGDKCPYYPGKRYEDWPISDPAGKSLDEVREIRDQIDSRVRTLLADMRRRNSK